jgi:hypothetical protein
MSAITHTPGPWDVVALNVNAPGDYKPVYVELSKDYRILISRTGNTGDACRIAAAPDLEAALSALLNMYVGMANSGDCGNWDPEEEQEVIAARAAIAKANP